jgi:putative Mg2+ transporter-C (MgtC) family protein
MTEMFAWVEGWLYNKCMSQFFLSNQDFIIRLLVASGLGLLIGLERVLVRKEAGMKTHALVSLGSALFVIISEMIAVKHGGVAGFDPSRIASQIVVGIGFLGAGSIMLQGNKVLGLTTAGGLWVTAGIGMAAGFGFYSLASFATFLVLLILIVVYNFEKPIREISTESDKAN